MGTASADTTREQATVRRGGKMRNWLYWIGFAGAIALFLGMAISEVSSIPFMAAFAGILLVLALLSGVAWFFIRQGDAETDYWARRITAVQADTDALSLDAARREATALLHDGASGYQATEDGTAASHLVRLGPTLREFFARYAVVDADFCGLRLDRAAIHDSELVEGHIALGRDGDDSEFNSMPGEDAVYVYLEEGDPGEGPDAIFPSVYHYLVYKHRLHSGTL